MVRLTIKQLDRLLADPAREARAAELERLLDEYGDEQERVFVPDVPIKNTIPIVGGHMWYHSHWPKDYAAMLERFKRVLEPLARDEAERWRDRPQEEAIAQMGAFAAQVLPDLDKGDKAIFAACYGWDAIDMLAAGEPGAYMYGRCHNGTHRLFVAQVMGSVGTLPAVVSRRTRRLSAEEIAERDARSASWELASDIVVVPSIVEVPSWSNMPGGSGARKGSKRGRRAR